MYLKVKVIAGARKESVEKVSSDSYNISVKEKAERNMANKRVLELVAQDLAIPSKNIRIINGHHSPTKLLSVQENY